jgi:hypothetical protein
MIVCIPHAKVGHCQAPYNKKSPVSHERGFFLAERHQIGGICYIKLLVDLAGEQIKTRGLDEDLIASY